MDKNNYLKLCGVVAVVTVLSILFIPGLSEFIEKEFGKNVANICDGLTKISGVLSPRLMKDL